MRNFMDLSRALKSLADAFHTIKLKLDGLYDSVGAIGNKFELIEEITLTEDTSVIERTAEPDGTPYNFSDIYILMYTGDGYTDSVNARIDIRSALTDPYYIRSFIRNATATSSMMSLINLKGYFEYKTLFASTDRTQTSVQSWPIYYPAEVIKYLRILSTTPFQGTIKIYGVRA